MDIKLNHGTVDKWNNRYIHKKKEIQDTGRVILRKNWRGGRGKKESKGWVKR